MYCQVSTCRNSALCPQSVFLCVVLISEQTVILTLRGPCIVSIFRCMSNKMQHFTVYLSLETALHVSGGISTHHQERIQLYLQHLVIVKPLLLPAAIVEELELSSNSSTHHQEHAQLYL